MKRVLLFALFAAQGVWAQNQHWVAAWVASPQAVRAPARPGQNAAPIAFNNKTVRMVVRPTLAGSRVRLQFSNAFGAHPLIIGAVHVAIHTTGSAIDPSTDRAVLFAGKPSCSIPAGAVMFSDALDMNVPRFGDLAVSVFLPEDTGALTTHALGLHTTYIKDGDATAQAELADSKTAQSWYFLSALDVMASRDTFAVVTFGDSITDGATSTADTDRSWPSVLATRLPATVAIANQGISGNRVLRDGAGVSALARFDRDVLGVSGVKWLTIMESINDIGIGTRDNNVAAADKITSDELIAALNQMVERAHTHGIQVAGVTLTPYEGAAYYSPVGETYRQAINQWIRTSGVFDAVLDFDQVTRDPDHMGMFRKDFNNTDHLHPNDAGYKAMAESVDTSWFTSKKPGKKKKQK